LDFFVPFVPSWLFNLFAFEKMQISICQHLGKLAAVLLVAALVGCEKSEPAQFRLDMMQITANQIIPEHQKAVANILDAMFGTPDEPFALPESGLDLRKLKMAAGPVWSSQPTAGKHGLYRRHCAHCHGVSGGGDGPTASILDPYPRDYRPAIYKFKSTYNPDRPTIEDLHRVVMNGVPGTAMPSFAVLPPDEVVALVEYVKYLSIRGQMETALVSYITEELDYDPVTGEGDPLDPANDADQREIIMSLLVDDIVPGWDEAIDQVIVPENGDIPPDTRTPAEIAASAAKGRELFYGTVANCVKCHGPTGLGDGQQDDYDNWSKATVQFEEGTRALELSVATDKEALANLEGEELAAAKTELEAKIREIATRKAVAVDLLDPRNAIPRNLRTNMFRGGRRPLDIFRRIHQGIAGTPMPASGPASPGAQPTLTEDEMWQIVDYIRSLPFEPASLPLEKPVNISEVVN
jgi:mono/diheme cytochrome c family protein